MQTTGRSSYSAYKTLISCCDVILDIKSSKFFHLLTPFSFLEKDTAATLGIRIVPFGLQVGFTDKEVVIGYRLRRSRSGMLIGLKSAFLYPPVL